MRVVERTTDKKGQVLLTPEIELEGRWTSLPVSDKKIVQLYADHGTSEQFHSEFKTDLDVERLPSGKFYGLLTADQAVAEDVNKLFHQMTGLGRAIRLKKLLQSPFTLHKAILDYIDAAIAHARAGKEARIIAKMNALVEMALRSSGFIVCLSYLISGR